jgi:hypothetical protein
MEDFLSADKGKYNADENIDSFMNRLRSFFSVIPYSLNNKEEKHYQTVFYLLFKLRRSNRANQQQKLSHSIYNRKQIYFIQHKDRDEDLILISVFHVIVSAFDIYFY